MKRNNQILQIVIAALVMATISSCKKDFDKINDNPNSPKDVPTSYILTGAEKGIMDNTCDRWWNGTVGNQLAQYWASNIYTEESRYQFRGQVTNDYWALLYAGGINDPLSNIGGLEELQHIIDVCTQDPAKYSPYGYPKNQIAVANILEVWTFQNITDTWGDVPYSEALKGVANPSPKYDKQEDIYKGLLKQLDSANAQIDVGQSGPAGDIIYGGDMGLWKKFCNSLKLRVAIRMIDRNPTLASQKIQEAVGAGVFTSNADNALFVYLETSPNINPINYDYYNQNRRDFCASETMTDVLTALNDPRIGAFYDSATAGGGYVGRPYGQTDADASSTPNAQIAQTSTLVRSATFPGIYMDYAQVEFILAEATERGINVGADAATHYNNGIQASFDFWQVSMPASYLTQSGVDYATNVAANGYKKTIGKQKWIALYMQGIQGWTEWRRLDFGIFVNPVGGFIFPATAIPTRMLYPTNEQSVNAQSYAAALQQQGLDKQETKVWWDIY